MRLAPLAALFALAAPDLGGCMMGPDFHNPDPPATGLYLADDQPAALVAAGIPGGEAQQIVQGLDIPGQWWPCPLAAARPPDPPRPDRQP